MCIHRCLPTTSRVFRSAGMLDTGLWVDLSEETCIYVLVSV